MCARVARAQRSQRRQTLRSVGQLDARHAGHGDRLPTAMVVPCPRATRVLASPSSGGTKKLHVKVRERDVRTSLSSTAEPLVFALARARSWASGRARSTAEAHAKRRCKSSTEVRSSYPSSASRFVTSQDRAGPRARALVVKKGRRRAASLGGMRRRCPRPRAEPIDIDAGARPRSQHAAMGIARAR